MGNFTISSPFLCSKFTPFFWQGPEGEALPVLQDARGPGVCNGKRCYLTGGPPPIPDAMALPSRPVASWPPALLLLLLGVALTLLSLLKRLIFGRGDRNGEWGEWDRWTAEPSTYARFGSIWIWDVQISLNFVGNPIRLTAVCANHSSCQPRQCSISCHWHPGARAIGLVKKVERLDTW